MFGQKSAFGGPPTGNTFGFGSTSAPAANVNPFGSPSNTSAFGQNNNTFGSSSFGSPSPSLFGSSSGGGGGGQQQVQQQQQQGSLLFGTPTVSTFGTQQVNNTFGQASTSTFGGSAFNKTGFGVTSTQPSLFGVNNTSISSPSSGSLFGLNSQSSSNFGSFGSTTNSSFGASNGGGGGTTIKFVAPSGTDAMMKSGVTQNISTRHQCISCMKEYENKSMEELRCEDYLVNRKGGGNLGNTVGAPLFGSSSSSSSVPGSSTFGSSSNSSLFGSSGNTAFGGGVSSSFGSTPFSTFTSNSSGFGGNATKPAFGAAPSSAPTFGGVGGFNSAPSSSSGLFDKGPSNTGGFFASPAPTPATNFFGSNSSGSTFGAPSFGSSTSSLGLFSQQQQQQQQQQNKPPLSLGGFSQPTSAVSTLGTFSTPVSNSVTPFGQPAASKSNFIFGNNSSVATPAFGASASSASAGGSLFGNKTSFGLSSNAPTFGTPSFGTPAFGAAPSTGGTSLFGFNASKPSGSLLGGPPSAFPTFGSTTSNGFSLGAPSSLPPSFGLPPQTPYAFTPNAIQCSLATLGAVPYGENPLFKNILTSPRRNDADDDVLKPTNPIAQRNLLSPVYKISPIRNIKVKAKGGTSLSSSNKNAMFSGLEDEDEESETSNPRNDVFVPRSSVKKLVLKRKEMQSSEEISTLKNTTTPTTPNAHHNNNYSTNALSHHHHQPNNNSLMREKESSGSNNNNSSSSILNTTAPLAPSSLSQQQQHHHHHIHHHNDSFSLSPPPLPPTSNESYNDVSLGGVVDDSFSALNTRNPRSGLGRQKGTNSELSEEEEEEDGDDRDRGYPAGIKLSRNGYYTLPSASELFSIVDGEGNVHVEGFTIGRNGYGNIYFPGVICLTSLNLDEIVFIRHKEVIVYPDDAHKPELGEGLNRKAQITLDKVWPIDKIHRSPITDPRKLEELRYEEKLEKASLRLGARFIEYRPETGSWVFKVDHFSKYGLEDSDEDEKLENNENEMDSSNLVKKTQHQQLQLQQQQQQQQQQIQQHSSLLSLETKKNNKSLQLEKREPELSRGLLEDNSQSGGGIPKSSFLNTEKVQFIKASLFQYEDDNGHNEDEYFEEDSRGPRPVILEPRTPSSSFTQVVTKPLFKHFGRQSSTSLRSLSNNSCTSLQGAYESFIPLSSSSQNTPGHSVESLESLLPLLPRTLKRHHFTSSLLKGKYEYLADAGLFINQGCRVGWGPFHSFVTPVTSVNFNVAFQRMIKDESEAQDSISYLIPWLETSLTQSIWSTCSTGAPKFFLREGLEPLESFVQIANSQFMNPSKADSTTASWLLTLKDVWNLMKALWGFELKEENGSSHALRLSRKSHLSEWLESVIRVSSYTVSHGNSNTLNENDEPMARILSHLNAHDLEKASELAHESGHHFAALLMNKSPVVESLLLNQLERWQEVHADRFISKINLSFYALMAGVPVWPASDGQTINTVENLDWKISFANHLWYLNSPLSSISDVLSSFENAFVGKTNFGVYSSSPNPPFVSSSSSTIDLCYHLLSLYSNKSHSLESLLCPTTHTPDELDYRLSWFVSHTLLSLGYRHMSPFASNELNANFATQIEVLGLWEWAIYPLLALSDETVKKSKVMDVLMRGLFREKDEETRGEKEEFLLERLHVPNEWIYEAKAHLATFSKNYKDASWFLIKAKNFNRAHEIILKHLIGDAIINEDFDYVYELLRLLASEDPHQTIQSWSHNGQIFYDFLTVDKQINECRLTQNEDSLSSTLEELKPVVLRLCSRISHLPVNSSKDRLCQSEIAKKMAHYSRIVLLSSAKNGSSCRSLAESLITLPLPDDYALQELRTLTKNYMLEIMEH